MTAADGRGAGGGGGDRVCPDDLLARGRRGTLSELEQRAALAHLAQCSLCATGRTVATLFSDGADTRSGDAEIVARVAARASARVAAAAPAAVTVTAPAPARIARGRGRARGGGRRMAMAAGLAVVCAGTVAAAWVAWQRGPAPAVKPPVTSPSPAPARAAAAPLAIATRHVFEDAARVPPEAAPRAASGVAARPVRAVAARAQAGGAAALDAREPASAAALFARAGAARRAGDLRRAAGLFRALRQRFPDSAEAHLSALSLGDLLLRLGEPGPAAAAFEAYLAESPAGPLAEEALVGRARALGHLGRADAERDVWRELVRRFPRSAYEPVARERLEALAR